MPVSKKRPVEPFSYIRLVILCCKPKLYPNERPATLTTSPKDRLWDRSNEGAPLTGSHVLPKDCVWLDSNWFCSARMAVMNSLLTWLRLSISSMALTMLMMDVWPLPPPMSSAPLMPKSFSCCSKPANTKAS